MIIKRMGGEPKKMVFDDSAAKIFRSVQEAAEA